jgi:PBP1b-binding outer membrane lipoprotein LpoB
MPSNKLLAVTLSSAMFLSGCYADAGNHERGPSVEVPNIDRPQSDVPFSAPLTLDPAPATRPEGSKEEEVVDLSLG